jgi:hypothetical protein
MTQGVTGKLGLQTIGICLTVWQMTEGRAKDRTRKTLSLPADLTAAIQAEADEKFGGDFTRAVLERLAMQYPEAREFLRKNTTWKHSRKKA